MTKTMGKFNIASKFNTQFNYEGYSKQCEIAFRDYMSWCTKNKAPKLLQAEYDRVLKADFLQDTGNHKPEAIFVLAVTAMIQKEFEKATNKKVSTAKITTKKDKEIKEFIAPDLNAMMAKVGGEAVAIQTNDKTTLEAGKDITIDSITILQETIEKAVTVMTDKEIQAAIDNGVSMADAESKVIEEAIITTQAIKIDYNALYNEYKAGGKVANICSREKISKSTFYANIKKFQ